MAPDRDPEAVLDRPAGATADAGASADAPDPAAGPDGRAEQPDPATRARRSVLRLVSVHGVRRTKHHEVAWG